MKKGRLIEELEEAGIIDKNLSIGAKHSKLKGLLNSISIAGSDNPLVEVEYKGKQSNVIFTTQGESTLKIFGERKMRLQKSLASCHLYGLYNSIECLYVQKIEVLQEQNS